MNNNSGEKLPPKRKPTGKRPFRLNNHITNGPLKTGMGKGPISTTPPLTYNRKKESYLDIHHRRLENRIFETNEFNRINRTNSQSPPLLKGIDNSDYIYETRDLIEERARTEEFIDYLKNKYETGAANAGSTKVKLNLQPKNSDFEMQVNEKKISTAYQNLLVQEEALYTKCNEDETEEIYQRLSEGETTLEDLIKLGDLYHEKKRNLCGRINLKTLFHLQGPLKELKNMVGLDKFKNNLIEQIVMCLQNLHRHPSNSNNEMFHTVIYGPPGVGKTHIARILGHIYLALGLIYKRSIDLTTFKIDDFFESASRSDLIGMYCGHTAVQTQKIIDNCRKYGKVLFIDETYSLGDKEGRDNFSKECIDTINKNLTEGAGEFICIIAGYPEDIKKCFFAHNKGLERRFNFRYTIDKYSPEELLKIFQLKLEEAGWGLVDGSVITSKFFEDNQDYFGNFGGDIVAFLTKCRIVYSKRVFLLRETPDRKLDKEDIRRALELFKKEREDSAKAQKERRTKEERDKEIQNLMYL